MSIENYGSYQLLRRLATGGMAQIYLARQKGPEGFEKLLVVKRILPHLAENADFVRMFLDEARIAARLNHPNIVQIFNLGAQDDSFFIAMEFIHGEDVRRVWKRSEQLGKSMPIQMVCRVIMDACAGLDYAHKKTDPQTGKPLGIVHRDISPQNILITFEGGVKVVDFGIAKAADQATVTRSGVLKGKYSYMSPEQASGKKVDNRSDIFALGVVLHELLTGQRLFKRANDIQTLHAVTECEVTPPSQLNPRLPRDLDAIVMKALAKDPANRYQEAIHLQMALEDWLITHKLPSSSAHLAAFMEELYSERLAEERRAGQVLVGEELESSPPRTPDDSPPPPPHQSQSNPSFNAQKLPRSSSGDGRLPAPLERLTDPRVLDDEPEATTAERGRRRPSQEGVFRDLLKAANGGATHSTSPEAANPADTLIGSITDEPARTASGEQPLTEPVPRVQSWAGPPKRLEDTVAAPSTSTTDRDFSRSFSSSQTPMGPGAMLKRLRMPPAVAAILASSLIAGAFAGYILLGPRAPKPVPVTPTQTYAQVHVDSEPQGATVLWDGKPADPTPCTLPSVPPGTYRLVVSKHGYRDHSEDVTVPATGSISVGLIRLEPNELPETTAQEVDAGTPGQHGDAPAAHLVAITLTADPPANVFVGDENKGRTPVTLTGEPKSEMEVRLERAGYRTLNRKLIFGEASRSEEIHLAPVRPPPPPPKVRTAKVRFAVTPYADDVVCNSRSLGSTPFPDVELPVGTLQCKVYNKQYGSRTVTFEVKPNILNKVPVKF